jgi:tetratricopeptide (TPR) repeat protein
MSENDIEKIEPVDFDAASSPVFASQPVTVKSDKPPAWVWLGLGVLAIVALAVIFVLPTIVTQYELPLERRVELETPSLTAGGVSPAGNTVAVSPFTEAQRSIQRKEAQDVLAALLAVQATLDSQGVEDWAAVQYAAAVQLATRGDDAYLTQDFIGAREKYQDGLDGMRAILDRMPTVLEQYLVEGEAALDAVDSAQAQEKFSIALRIDPQNEQAQIGIERAGNLNEVSGMLAEALELRNAGRLEDARSLYMAVLDLDSRNAEGQRQFDEVNQLLLEQRFGRVMSEGYSLLQNDQPEQAIEAFARAAALGINRNQAEAAIQQNRDEVARVEIERLREQADTAAGAERWQDSVTAYEAVLDIDTNLLFAQQGLDYAGKRLRLDQLLEEALASPERFADDEIYQETVDVYYTGRSLETPGPRLQSQLDRLQVLLENSQVPVTVNFQSDNATQVTVLRIATLGTFESESLALKPGRYVAVGVKEGFRDVREEFTVGFGQTPQVVVIQCDERVTAGRSR